MLYDRWCRVASQRPSALALSDLFSGQHWTFRELRDSAESYSCEEEIVYPQGHSAEFILALLAAWRLGKVTCPLEPGGAAPKVPRPPSGCVHLKSTSATGGVPRLVAFTASQLAADAENIVATMGLRADWPNLGVISIAHYYGFSNLVLPLLLHGIPLVLVPSPWPETVRRASEHYQALTLAAVPALWRAWHEAGAIPPQVRLAISAGAPLQAALEGTIFKRHRLKVHNFYGSTECGGIAYDASETPRTDDACVGAPLRNVRLSLGPDGCLAVESAAVGQSYWPQPSESLAGGRFRTSDLAEVSGGVVRLCGRLSDQINVAGRKIAPATVEAALCQHPDVDECLVFGVPSPEANRAESIVACIVARHPVASERLRTFLMEKLSDWQLPRFWWFVDSLAVNSRGKISRSEWRERYLAQQPPATAGVSRHENEST